MRPGDLIGPGLAFDETAQLKDGEATACVAPQHAGCTGHVENCVTTVFATWVTTFRAGLDGLRCVHARAVGDGPGAARGRGHPWRAGRAARPQLAKDQLERLLTAPPARWAAFDEVYGRSSALRGACEAAGLPTSRSSRGTSDHPALRRGDQGRRRRQGRGLRAALVRERVQGTPVRGLGPGRHRQPAARPADPPPDLPAGQPDVLPVLGPGRPARHDDVLRDDRRAALALRGNVQNRKGHARLGPVPGAHLGRDLPDTALAALAQLRHAAIRNALCGDITLPPPLPAGEEKEEEEKKKVSGADLGIPLGDAPVPARPGQPCPPRIGAIKLTIAETARLTRLAREYAAGLITRARLAFHLRWSRWRRQHQARARWHHYATRLAAAST